MNFISSKKNIKKYSPPKKKNIFLFVQVFQMGIIQVEKKFKLNSFFYKNIKIGCGQFCDLSIPFDRHTFDLNIFKVGKGRAEIFLDPRLDGYINTSQKFGEVREFTSPRDALGILTSIDDPLAVDLKLGARGRIRFLGFEIIFKIDLPKKEKIYTNLPKIERNFLQLPNFDSPIEKVVIPISIFATACLFIPIIYWLLTFPSKSTTGLLSIPAVVTAEFVAPENMRLLPFVFGSNFFAESTPQLALLWINELQMRWANAEKGKEYLSVIPFLTESKLAVAENEDVNLFQKKIITQYINTESKRKLLSEKERYYKYLKKSPMLATVVTGSEGQSNYFIIEKRIQQLAQIDKALLEYLKLEHKILKTHYQDSYGAKKTGIVLPPQTGQVLGPQPDPIFFKELLGYKNAEVFAEISENSSFRSNLKKFVLQQKEKSNKFNYFDPVFISEKELIYPYQFMDQQINMNNAENYELFLFNSLFSDAFVLPPLPKPKAIIDLNMVQFVVYNKKEEVRSCYNSALRRNNDLNGEVKLSWMINEFGKAQDIMVVGTTIKDMKLFHCIESRIKTWKFPKSINGSSKVNFPFKFVKVERK